MIHRLPLVILISAAILLSSNITFAAEKPKIFVQMAKENIIYFSSLKFTQEARA